jgi:hypothetical protein
MKSSIIKCKCGRYFREGLYCEFCTTKSRAGYLPKKEGRVKRPRQTRQVKDDAYNHPERLIRWK